jgi:GNAT superfamily N-acetyltransferase
MPSEPESPLQRLRRSCRDIGPRYAAQNVVKTCFPERVLHVNTAFIVEVDLRDWPRDQAPEPDMRWATEDDGKLFGQADMSKAELHDYLARGARVAICQREGVLVGFFTYETGNIDHLSWLRYRMAADIAWCSMAWTAPRFRGKGVHAHVHHFAVSELSRQGYVRTLASIDALNVSSLQATVKHSTIVGSLFAMRSFGLTAVWVNGQVRFGDWHEGKQLELDSDLFRVVPNRPYGPVDAKRFERLIGKRS